MGNKKKKWMIGLAVFLLVMLALTIISRSVYAYYLPLVETTTVQEKYIEHGFEEEGLVVADSGKYRKRAADPADSGTGGGPGGSR